MTVQAIAPAILLGVLRPRPSWRSCLRKLVSGALGGASAYVAIVVIALALPTFGEIPLALALISAATASGMIVALLIAGPVINLPRSSRWLERLHEIAPRARRLPRLWSPPGEQRARG